MLITLYSVVYLVRRELVIGSLGGNRLGTKQHHVLILSPALHPHHRHQRFHSRNQQPLQCHPSHHCFLHRSPLFTKIIPS